MRNLSDRQEQAIVTVIAQEGLSGKVIGRKKLFTRTGGQGALELPWLEDRAWELAQICLAKGTFEVAGITNPATPEQKATIMIDPYLLPYELLILGGGHIALPLVKIGHLLGYKVTVVDDRPDFVSSARFPEADRGIYGSFTELEELISLGARSCVVIVTRGHRHDLDCLRRAIKYPLAYLGMIGSRQRVRMVRQQLIAEGFPLERINSVHMPIGLDISAQTPEEIAVSIAAQLIKVCRGNKAASPDAAQQAYLGQIYEMPSAVDLEALQQAVKVGCNGKQAALATIVKTRGSTPRKVGARMLVFKDGRVLGTIGGGCGESEVCREALNVMNEMLPHVYKVSLDAETAAMEGIACGGLMEVFIEPAALYGHINGYQDSTILER